MWAAFLGALFASLVDDEEEGDEEEKRGVIGLGGQLSLRVPTPADGMVLVRAWTDGASLWRIVSWNAHRSAEMALGKTVRPMWDKDGTQLFTDLDAGKRPESVWVELSSYVYVEGPEGDSKPSVLFVIDDPEDGRSASLSEVNTATELPETSRFRERLWEFLCERDDFPDLGEALSPTDSDLLWGKAGMVEDGVVSALTEMRKRLEGGKDGEAVAESLSEPSWRTWATAYVELWWKLKEYEGLLKDISFWSSATSDDPDVISRLKEEQGEDEANDLLSSDEQKRGSYERSRFERFCESQVEFLQEQEVELRVELELVASNEAGAADKLLWNLEIVREKNLDTGEPSWEVAPPWRSKYDDPTTTVKVQRSHGGPYSYDIDKGRLRGKDPVGLLETLLSAGLVETRSGREEKKGTTAFIWPSRKGYQGVWEFYAALELYRARATDPLVVFLKVSNDHGLLSEFAKHQFAKLLLALEEGDPLEKMREEGLLRKK